MNEAVTKTLEHMELLEIMKFLPHRYPFLLVDRIIEIEGDDSAVGVKNVTANEPHFTGHFPSMPIMPGVLIVEGMAQTAGAICARKANEVDNLVYFMTIDNALHSMAHICSRIPFLFILGFMSSWSFS